MPNAHWLPPEWFVVYITIAWCIRAGMVPVVLRRELAPGAAIAWLGIVFLHPYIGLALYMTFGETRLGARRADEHRQLAERFRVLPSGGGPLRADVFGLPHDYEPMVLQAEKISGLPVVGGNDVEFIGDVKLLVDRLVADINAASREVHLLYFIFACDGTGGRVIEALKSAAQRGIKCQLLVDAVGSRRLLHSEGVIARLRTAGVSVAAALPVAPITRRLPRMDLRNHRKLALIDGRIAYAGSHNLINPDYGEHRAGPWVDLSARFTGPLVDQFAIVFHEDWTFETGEELPPSSPSSGTPGEGRGGGSSSDVSGSKSEIERTPSLALPRSTGGGDKSAEPGVLAQVVPTGPSPPGDNYRRVLLAAVQCARQRVILTTPYFVPDEPTLVALQMAADRGVEVTLIVPQRPDHPFTAAAGRAHYSRLMASGVAIWQYRAGLIHSKTTTVDDAFALMGSANLDVRSFNLNFELSVLLYGAEVTQRLRDVQTKYLAEARRIDPAEWSRRPIVTRYAERAVSLLSPLL
jgi:cardiolipin synthase